MAERPAPQPRTGDATYHSSVVAPMQLLLGVASGVAVAVVLEVLDSDLWPAGIIVFLAAVTVAWLLAPITVAIAGGTVTVGQGKWQRDPTVIYVAEIREAGLRQMTWLQCLGFGGVESDDRTTRLAVRPGTTLVLTLHDGQRWLVSVADGPAALRAIEAAAPA